ncbi:TPA: hypothetical protein N0F65_001862 [Lagenidium giganteum]|uniref:IPO4/5-like TPR repeats domain-containing protein n=1 Tax=Lagenidium giganteum TaxID=4803 RepID=A0AAV2YP18_9STRA|nr:TPA: hypothetical protein N0F65_001862 [Lagenidium giganteum]
MTDFHALVAALSSNDNNTRKYAEEAYVSLQKDQPQTLVLQLLHLIRSVEDQMVRAFAPVMLRRVLEAKSGVYANLDAASQNTVKVQLLEAMAAEPVAHIRRKLAHVVAEVAAVSQQMQQPWPELLEFTSALTNHQDQSLRETAFDLIAKLAEYVGEILAPHKESFLTLFTNSLNDANGAVQVASLKASASFLMTLDQRDEITAFGVIIAPMLRIIEAMLKAGDEVTFREVLSSLVQVAEIHPKFFRHALDDLGRAMVFISSSQDLDAETRELAMEFLLALSENAGGMVRKSPFVVSSVVPLALQLMCEVEEDPEWLQKFDDAETFSENAEGDNSISDAGAAAIDRLSGALGGSAVLPVAIPVIKTYLGDADWRKRRAALYATCLLGEGAKQLMTRELDNVMAMVMPFLNDQHPRVQYACIHCIGQLAQDLGEVAKGKNFQAKFHNSVLPALTAVLQNEQVVLRTRALAAAVVINFCDPNVCKAKYVKKHCEALLSALFNAMRTCPRQVQEQTITAVATVAKVIGTDFQHFYAIFMPLAKDVLLKAHGKEYSLLRGKAMESIALIGQAVGKELFVQDAKEVMEILIRVQSNESLEGPEVQYVAQSCVRIGNILGNDFVPYLPHVVPPLIRQAQAEVDIVLSDITDEDEFGDDEDTKDSWTVSVGTGKKRLQINTTALEEKTTACNMLYQCALDLEGNFFPYLPEVASVLIPLMKFQYVEDIRIVSALSMARLLNAAIDGIVNHGQSPLYAQQLLDQFLEPLLDSLQSEDDLECVGAFAEATSACLEVCKEGAEKGVQVGIRPEHTTHIVEILKTIAQMSAQRRVAQLQENEADEDYDEEAAAQQGENDEYEEGIFRSMVDSIGWIIKTQKEAFFPIAQAQLLPFINPLLEQDMIDMIRGQMICMIDDIIEHCGAPAQELVPMFVSHLVKGLEDPSPSVIQAAAYGVGVCAEKPGSAFDAFCVESLEKLVQLIMAAADADDEEVAAARDNAVSAVAKILVFRQNLVDSAKLWPVWLTWLPLTTDVLEARDLHARFISLVESGHPTLLGANSANLPTILKVFAAILMFEPLDAEEQLPGEEEEDMAIITDDAKAQLRAVLVKLQTQLPGAVVQGAWAALSAEEQQAFSQL